MSDVNPKRVKSVASIEPTPSAEANRFKTAEQFSSTPVIVNYSVRSDQPGTAERKGGHWTPSVKAPTRQEDPSKINTVAGDGTAAVAERAYPHRLEAAQPALRIVRQSLIEANEALDDFEDGDIAGVAARLSVIAVQCAAAHPLTTFNESFGAVISYVRRAAIAADPTETSRESLNSLAVALNTIVGNPTIDLGDAADILTALTESGWNGQHATVERLISLMLDEVPDEAAVGVEMQE